MLLVTLDNLCLCPSNPLLFKPRPNILYTIACWRRTFADYNKMILIYLNNWSIIEVYCLLDHTIHVDWELQRAAELYQNTTINCASFVQQVGAFFCFFIILTCITTAPREICRNSCFELLFTHPASPLLACSAAMLSYHWLILLHPSLFFCCCCWSDMILKIDIAWMDLLF